MTGIRCITGELTSIQDADERFYISSVHPFLLQRFRDSVSREFRHRTVQLVGNEAQKSLVKLLVEGRMKILLQERIGKMQALEGHLGSLSVSCSHYIGLPDSHSAEDKP